nr:immunoglobulin heavy chain junction region [Mus musculus]MBK4185076.1 immunoglobulin heavy chain junction region [Mus musculus]MBK4185077.1 immunoglobulin heavy chain junction region [Mus musculus]MBK4185078.1 immunoglobulin heavy chain junction region [Mus musculus]
CTGLYGGYAMDYW